MENEKNAPTWPSSEEGEFPSGFTTCETTTGPSTCWVRDSPYLMPSQCPCSPHRSCLVFKCLSKAEMTNLPALMCWGDRHFHWRLLEATPPYTLWAARACRDFGGRDFRGGCESRWKWKEAHWCRWHPSSHPTKNMPSLLCLLSLIFRCRILSHSKQ